MSHLLTPDHLAALARAGVVVLSPHFDDACFSLGGVLQRVGTGELVNVFNRSVYLPRPPADRGQQVTEEMVGTLRGAEDQAFADRCGLRRTMLDGAEPAFHGRRPKELEFVQQDIEAMRDALLSCVLARSRPGGPRAYLLAPMAVGRHVNHHAVHAVVARAVERLSPLFHICLYEDLPYASDAVQRTRRLRAFRSAASWKGWRRCVYEPGWRLKRELIGLYATQLKREPPWWKFRPASLWPWAVHEALWMDGEAWSALNAGRQ